jgi:hypothetical protein
VGSNPARRAIFKKFMHCFAARICSAAHALTSFTYVRREGKLAKRSLRIARFTPAMIFAFSVLSLVCGYSSEVRAEKAEAIAARLGFDGCRLSKPLTMSQVMAKDMSGGSESSRAHPDWDELITRYASGDQIYFVDCRKAESSRIFAGTSLYVLVREGVVIARARDTISK